MPKESVRILVSPRSGRSEAQGKRSEIESVCVYGYKSVAKPCTVSLAPLTLLAGTNSSGKSSLLQPILLIKQTLEASFDPGPLLLNGPNVKFTSADQLFARRPGQKTPERSFGIRFSLSGDRQLELKFKRLSTQLGLDVESTVVTEPALGIENLAISPKLSPAAIETLKTLPSPFAELQRGTAPTDWDVSTRRCFLEVLEVFEEGDRRYGLPSPVNDLVQEVEALVSQVIHLPGLRGGPVRTHPRTAPGSSTYPGQFQDYVASIVYQWQEGGDSKLQGVASDLEELGLTWRVEAVAIDDTRIELRVGRLPHVGRGGDKDLLNLADVGLGTSQILPVLVALRVAEPGQLVVLEQPETHLHPRAQSELAGILVRAALRGVRVVAETHSSLLLRGIQTLIARDEIPQDLVGLNWITRNQATGSSIVSTASVDEYGRFGDWPEDFDEVTLQAEKDYLDAVEDKYAKW